MGHTSARWALIALLAALLGACGGGGGGGGSSGGGGGGGLAAGQVTFTGFGFVVAGGDETTLAPKEDPGSQPPTLGAPLDLAILFHFSGVPAGPFSQASLPVYTTPGQVPPSAKPPIGSTTIPAKGTYALSVNPDDTATVTFSPFVPTAPLQADFTAPPEAVPGLLPGSTYTALVSTSPATAIGNLKGAGGQVAFGTTSNPAAYYPKGVSDTLPPAVAGTEPATASGDFQPATFAGDEPAVPVTAFPDGPSEILVTYDQPVEPSLANLEGTDLDGDGLVDPNFFFASRATRLMVGHSVPAGTLGSPGGFEALTAFEDGSGAVVAPDGSDILLADGAPVGIGEGEALLPAPIASLASGIDPGLLYAVLDVDGGNDLFTVFDHLLGDPSHALQAVDGLGDPLNLDTGLDELVGLTTLLDGRMVAYDRTTRRIHELMPSVLRDLPTVGDPTPGAPRLLSLAVGDGVTGFRSEPLVPAGVASELDIRDLALAPDGRLHALAVIDGVGTLALLRLAAIDPDADGQHQPGEGLFSGAAEDLLLTLAADYVDMVFDGEGRVLALNAGDDTVDVIDPLVGPVQVVAHQVGGFGAVIVPSPARALAVGTLEIPAEVSLTANSADGAVIVLEPPGVLPIGAELRVMQRHAFSTLLGVSSWNADPTGQVSALGAVQVMTLTTAAPVPADPMPFVDDVFFESFDDTSNESPSPATESPTALWAQATPEGNPSGGLRASVGVGGLGVLGDFLPTTGAQFNDSFAYRRSKNPPEVDLNYNQGEYSLYILDTDAQPFPMPNGATPGVTQALTIFGGEFAFRDFIVPAGVHLIVRGSNPLRITATGRVEIHGLIDVEGTDGFNDDTFDSGFLPVPGGAGGPGAGRGGDAHPTLADPSGPGSIDQYVTPETAERGWGPVVDGAGKIKFQQVGGHGGLSTLGYDPFFSGLPKAPNSDNDENHRPPGGGGGSYYYRGGQAHEGSGSYRVQSDSTWFPFTQCPGDDKITMARYGNEENLVAQLSPVTPIQCVYLEGTPSDPSRKKPGGLAGDLVFKDGDPSNDFIGEGGELTVLMGGQGGGGGGTRIDSMRHGVWAADGFGSAVNLFFQPHYPALFLGVYVSATVFDAKGGAGGGGGGAFSLRAFGDILVSRTGRISARGGHGGGGERVRNSNFAGGGGGGSGGAIILQAAGSIVIEADPGHVSAGYIDLDGDLGASIDVSGGFGRDARTAPGDIANLPSFLFDATRGDGGQGGFGLIQAQSGDGSGMPLIDDGAFLYARLRTMIKLGSWTGDNSFFQGEHPAFGGQTGLSPDLRYIDMLHYRYYKLEGTAGTIPKDHYYVLNGSYPPIIPSATGDFGQQITNEFPAGSGQFWYDSPMLVSDHSQGVPVVQEPEPHKVMKTYLGWNIAFNENEFPSDHPDFPSTPGETYKFEEIPLSVDLNEPDGTPITVEVDGVEVFDPENMVDRLPVVPMNLTPPPLGTVSLGTSAWIAFPGTVLRPRDAMGRTPPFFSSVHGTYNEGVGPVPSGEDGRVILGGAVPGAPARYVANAGFNDPGLLSNPPGGTANPPFNDLKVDAPDEGVATVDAVSNNAAVSLLFQGAHPIRPGSQVPDPDTLTAWVADVTSLDGHALVRFQVRFDLSEDQEAHPFGADSMRPQVDWVRLRTSY
jgi:hypothetical protein